MYDLISVGHISIDLFFQGESLTFKGGRFQLAVGGKYFADYLYTSVGGGGANVAIGAGKNGLRTAVSGIIGNNPFKSIILHDLADNRVSTSLCKFHDDFLNISSILLTKQGERSIVNYEPTHSHLLRDRSELTKLTHTKAFYLGNMPGVLLSERTTMLKYMDNKGILTIVNLGVKDCRKPLKELSEILMHTRILIVNGYEFADLVKQKFSSLNFEKNVTEGHKELEDKIVIVTAGGDGSYGYFQGKVFRQKAHNPSKIVDTTGCGDAYTAGFIAQFLRSKNIEAAMKKGSEYAALILSQVGAN